MNDEQFSVILEQEKASVDRLAYNTLLHPDIAIQAFHSIL